MTGLNIASFSFNVEHDFKVFFFSKLFNSNLIRLKFIHTVAMNCADGWLS